MRTLLLVDDEPHIHFTVGQVFADQPLRLLSAETVEAALQVVRTEQPEVVLLDIRLGQRSGLEVFHELRSIDPKLLVIFITGHGTTDTAIEAITAAGLKELVLLARRGPAQAAFTTPEVIELQELAGADAIVDPTELELDAVSEASLADDTNAERNLVALRAIAALPVAGKPRRLQLRFCVSPVEILGDGKVEAIVIERNRLEADEQGRISAVPTGERETIPCSLVLRSVGYRGIAIAGVAFDERAGTIRNAGGRITDEAGAVVPGAYCAGWIKRGPSGVIGTNKKCAAETVELLLEDAAAGTLPAPAAVSDLADLLAERGVTVISYAGWQKIDAAELAAGEAQGRPRVKLTRWADLLAAASA